VAIRASQIIDSHQHVWDPAARAQPWLDSDAALAPLRRRFDIGDLAPQAKAAGVAATVVVQTVTEPGETPELLALAATEPLVAAIVGWTDLTSPAVRADLSRLRALPGGSFLTGIRHPLLTEPATDWLARPDVRRGLSAVAAAGMCFDLVLQPHQLPTAIAVATGLPELTFVLDHLGNVAVGPHLDADWAAAFTALAALPNTVCKLSGILGEAGTAEIRPYLDLAVECFGPDRLMFGSDWPVCTLTASYGTVVTAAAELTGDLSGPEQQAVLADTAGRVYRIAESDLPRLPGPSVG
jgi:L-fuconolactonase